MAPERVAEIVSEIMPIAGGGEIGEALRLYVRAAIASSVASEREACALVADAWLAEDCIIARGIADEIRARGYPQDAPSQTRRHESR